MAQLDIIDNIGLWDYSNANNLKTKAIKDGFVWLSRQRQTFNRKTFIF